MLRNSSYRFFTELARLTKMSGGDDYDRKVEELAARFSTVLDSIVDSKQVFMLLSHQIEDMLIR